MARTKLNFEREDVRNSFGTRRRFKGKMGVLQGRGKHKTLVPRSHHFDNQLAKISHECGQNQPYPTKNIPGQFKVQIPHGRIRYVDQA